MQHLEGSGTPVLYIGRTVLKGCPRLLIQYICSYLPYLEAVSYIHNMNTRHVLVTETN